MVALCKGRRITGVLRSDLHFEKLPYHGEQIGQKLE